MKILGSLMLVLVACCAGLAQSKIVTAPAYSITETTRDYEPRAMQNVSSDAGRTAESESAVAPGTLSVTAQVTVRFRLNP